MRILVIDDDQKISEFLKSNLETELFAVDVATDGEQGAFLGRSVVSKKNFLQKPEDKKRLDK